MAIEVFTELQNLVGGWSGKTSTGQVLKVSYRLIANDTALIETWILVSGQEALTIYHMDGSQLIASHYCPKGNQPRLRLQPGDKDCTYLFEFFEGTNLKTIDVAHQHRFELRLLDRNHFVRSETYCENERDETETISYVRQMKL